MSTIPLWIEYWLGVKTVHPGTMENILAQLLSKPEKAYIIKRA